MKMIALVVVAVVVAACDTTTKGSRTAIGFSPTPAIAAQFSPQTLSIAQVTSTCASSFVFTTGFDLVIVQTSAADLFMDRVTLHLLDGTNVGNSPITFGRSQLTAMFGSTFVGSSRAFGFRPQFGCGLRRPLGIVADVILMDGRGSGRTVSVNAAFQ
jgi:hypothetical protein